MKPDVERELAHILLVELLAHQFTFPVKWIETQDVLLMEQGVERLVEIGPAPILTNMAKRTMENLYDGIDPLIKQREFLSATKDMDMVYYRAETPMAEDETLPVVSLSAEIVPAFLEPRPAASPTVETSQTTDIALTVDYLLRTILAIKLKKSHTQIESASTIKQLAGGRSTMENEIIGDLIVEFKNLPDRAEEQCISTLCKSLEPGFSGQLGGYTGSQVLRLCSTRMPAGFNLPSIRDYLKNIWGLSTGRQNMIVLLAVMFPPLTRLKTIESAEVFFDDLVSRHALETDTTVKKTNTGLLIAEIETIDPSVLHNLNQARRSFAKNQLQAYAKDLGYDLRAGEKEAATTQIALDEALEELDLWNAEHGSVYASGITPLLQVAKIRRFQSWSHWAQQDVTLLFHQIMRADSIHDEQAMAVWILHISNCATPRLVDHIRAFCARAESLGLRKNDSRITILESLKLMCERAIATPPVFRTTYHNLMPVTKIGKNGQVDYVELPRVSVTNLRNVVLDIGKDTPTITEFHQAIKLEFPNITVKTNNPQGWKANGNVTDIYLRAIQQLDNQGGTFIGKTVLITGAGPYSIGSEMLKGLLAGGAQVVCTTSKLCPPTADKFREIYATHGGRGSRLEIVPFNQASMQDVDSLVSYIYSDTGLRWDLDLVLPFAAIPEEGRDISQIDAKSELAHRAMLTNTIRLLGSVMRQKQIRGIRTRPAYVVLPLSANHGMIGGDGLYAESKLALESLLHKWHSEEWSSYLSLCGAEIGWTRGTGLMNNNDIIAQEVEKLGVRTFSREELAANILALCLPSVVDFCQDEPILVDLNGGLDKVQNIGKELKVIRARIQESKAQLRAVFREQKTDQALIDGPGSVQDSSPLAVAATPVIDLSSLPSMDYESHVQPLVTGLQGMVDLDHTTVITGFAELGPFGSARTRMQMEMTNDFTDAGWLELAWISGLICKSTKPMECDCWIDSETGEVVHQSTIRHKYKEQILKNTGIRLVDSEPQSQQILQEIVLEADLPPFTTTAQTAIEYARVHGNRVEIWKAKSSEDWHIQLKAGATIMIPKSTNRNTTAVGQLPKGWTPKLYGIDESIITQVDSTTLYALVATVEALLVSGIPDFYDLYKHIHPSEVANCIGSGQGGMSSLRSLFRDRYTDQTVQNDILQETFVNTTGAWINMLLLGASGPIRTPVGACATALESLDSAHELIASGNAKIALVGGVDDWTPEVGNEFRNMKATIDYEAQQASGRAANEFSRPMATTRAGFVESQGAGIQVVTSARLALDLGLPIHGIVAFTGLASDKPGRSVPAPGKGLLGFAASAETSRLPSPMLKLSHRRRTLERRLAQIEETRLEDIADLKLGTVSESPDTQQSEYLTIRQNEINLEAKSAIQSARNSLCNTFYHNDKRIAPLTGALSVWGLDASSISVLCMHGTSTTKGDTNEATVLNTQLSHLGRSSTTPPALAVCSKWLTGHAKGAAGSWALNTALQILATGVVPRNGNLDDLSPELADLEHISFLGGRGEGVQIAPQTPVDVVSVSAFGFGQKGAQTLIVHPRYLFASLEGGKDEFEEYWLRMKARRRVASRELQDGMWHGDLVGKRIKKDGVWKGNGSGNSGGGGEVDEVQVLLDRGWRAS